ncbi:type ISP restriction/modification enzyme [Aminobacter sp. MDW-2]|uniref:type ISP restriction/modification enzyme n=1 Tax=Aminobacter sp. MDW-2 TaxID=2666139 RepID=UPI0012B038CF|nr:type ISP restriction/modification enzyme [Aminobacter sp. MDW-2]MRX37182.1 hypothetical protein [Aminobacter sp. MDW-2]QNH33269.1 putative DNA binding domain-containing protein [Aminobacter sp. MDW-2]
MGIPAGELARINSFPKLIDVLRDHLDWPIGEDYGFDEVVFEYEARELGLKPEETAKIREIHQLRPLARNQPWGIFFVSFEDKALSVTVLRRILRSLVVKKRAGTQPSDRQAWEKSDLIFAANFGRSGDRELAFVHFSDGVASNDLPVMKVLGWNAKDTGLHNDHVGQTLTSKLRWPEDQQDSDMWRKDWSGAFELRLNETIRTAKELAVRLAALASEIRARVNELLGAETDAGPMRTMLQAFRKSLIQDLDNDGFADMFAQTIAYGMLAARISRPGALLVADNLADMVPKTNPFLKELFESFLKLGGRDKRHGMDFDELGVRDVVDMLNAANMEAVLRDFGDRNPKEDPVIHFYELFLKEYDPQKRMQRGVFYTPRPVVNFIVRGVDEILRTEFGLRLGLADTSTWAEVAARNNRILIPEHVKPDAPFVQILDPATGTGTFLVEVIELIHKRMEEHWKEQGKSADEIKVAWNDYVPAHLLPRLTAFELMMAPYTIAHMKVGLKLSETGYNFGSEQRARIFLTNALEPARDLGSELGFISEALAHEARASNTAKKLSPFTVVVGNPPYANYSANLGETARSLVDRYRHFRGERIRDRNPLQFERNIQDDYVKFLSLAQSILERSDAGVVSYITNGVILSSTSLRGVRENLFANFDSIFELNLHGGTNEKFSGAAEDENVFDIAQMVAIHRYSRWSARRPSAIHNTELLGSRESKYEILLNENFNSLLWDKIIPDDETLSFSGADDDGVFFDTRLDDVFVQFGAGIKTNNDANVIFYNENELVNSVRLGDFGVKITGDSISPIFDILYRPFDVRKIFYHKDAVKSRSMPTMKHMIEGANIGLVASSTWTSPERFSVSISEDLIEMKTGTHDRGTTLFPLYSYGKILAGDAERQNNLSTEFIAKWKEIVGLKFVALGSGDLRETVGPDDVLSWLYFLFHAPVYRARLSAALSRGFPIVLLPATLDVLREAVALGRKLIALHTLDPAQTPLVQSPEIRFAGSGEARVQKGYPEYKNGKVMINASRWFEDVPKATWEFHVGGYQVCEKWLKDRAGKGGKNPSLGRVLTEDDILHYRRVVTALTETRRLMDEIDAVIDRHGGWPDAFYVPPPPPPTIEQIIKADEGQELEYKSTLQFDLKEATKSKLVRKAALKTIVAFLNSGKGSLVIGVSDEKEIVGLEPDFSTMSPEKRTKEWFQQTLVNLINEQIGSEFAPLYEVRFATHEEKMVAIVDVRERAPKPAYLKDGDTQEFYVRTSNLTKQLKNEEIDRYISTHWRG